MNEPSTDRTDPTLVNRGLFRLGPPTSAGPATIVVLGVARGGTSIVAGALSLLGLPMGERAVDPVYEDPGLADLCESGDWNGVRSCIAAYDARWPSWGFKRPSAIRYVERLQPLLRGPRFVAVFRDLASIAQRNVTSMRIADPLANMRAAWRDYGRMLDVVEACGVPALVVSSDKAVRHRAHLIKRLAAFAGLEPDRAQIEAATTFISPTPARYIDQTRVSKSGGRLVGIRGGSLVGRAHYVHDRDRPAEVVIRIDGREADRVTADQLSHPELPADPGGRRDGFAWPIPAGLRGSGATLSAQVADDVAPLPGSPCTLDGTQHDEQ